MAIGGYTETYAGWGRGAEDAREGNKHPSQDSSEWKGQEGRGYQQGESSSCDS